MSIVIPNEILESSGLTPEQLKMELAIMLYQRGGLTLAQASEFCGMSRVEFQKELMHRNIPINYDEADLEADLRTLDEMRNP